MKNEQKQLKMGSLLALMIFGVFVVCVLLVLLMGADGYRRMTERDGDTYESRTAVQYLTTRIHQGDVGNSISVKSFGGRDALVLSEEVDGEVYETKLYCHDGWLMECYAAAGSDLFPADGERLLEMEKLEVSLADGFLQMCLTLPHGAEQELSLQLRSGREVLP